MKKIILLFSHTLTKEQVNDLKNNWSIESIIALPKELQNLWSNIDPDLESLEKYLKPIEVFVDKKVNIGDLVLIQGDFGACYKLVKYVSDRGMIPVYATTKRTVEEYMEDGKWIKKSIFEHRRFRKYE